MFVKSPTIQGAHILLLFDNAVVVFLNKYKKKSYVSDQKDQKGQTLNAFVIFVLKHNHYCKL